MMPDPIARHLEVLADALATPGEGAPRDPRNRWRVIDAEGVSREVASEGNARSKASGYDRVCPSRECPHRVEYWTGATWEQR